MRPSWPNFIEEERYPVYRLPRGRRDAVQRQADEPAHKAQAGPQAIGRDGEIDRHRLPLEIGQVEIRARQSSAEAGIIQPGRMPHDRGQHRAAFPLRAVEFRPVEVRGGGACGDALAGFGIGLHCVQGVRQVAFRGGDDAAQLRHRAPIGGQGGDIDQQAAQQLAGGVGPMRVRVIALDGDQHVRQAGGATDHIGGVGIQCGVDPTVVSPAAKLVSRLAGGPPCRDRSAHKD
jgi:hypothetical protein